MVCFSQFRYQVAKSDLEKFFINANRYFPDVKWEVSCGDMTIKSTDIRNAVTRLNPADGDVIIFDTGRIWDSLSFWQSLPRLQPCEVSEELRQKLSPQVDLALRYNDREEENIGQQIDWTTVPQFMTLVHERSPVVSYYPLPSLNMIIYESAGRYGGEPGLSCIYIDDGKFSFTYAPRVVFDMDDGFMDAYGNGPAPKELVSAFEEWVEKGRTGPVLG